ncbi:MAG: WYL domain-containing protein [Gemmatimonadaceae bacterium]|nr:WYL domain-containing protein [Gemmatimonadaceae bacterium]
MTDTASAQLKRVLHLIPRLADGEEHALTEVAAAAETSPAELLRDLESISERFDAPGGFVEGVSILVEENTVCVTANQFHRPMRLTMPELCALELGLSMLRRERTPAEQAPIDRALGRLRDTITHVPTNDRHEGTRYADLGASGSADHLASLRGALSSDRKVELRYRAGGATESSTRTICPHSLAHAEHMWYLVATGDDGTLRFFRLDRVEAIRVLDETFERDGAAAVRVQETGRAFVSDTSRRMTVRYSPRIARWVAEREGQPLAADGSLTMEHPVADESWAIRHVLQYGPDAELIAPPELRAMMSKTLRSFGGVSR